MGNEAVHGSHADWHTPHSVKHRKLYTWHFYLPFCLMSFSQGYLL